MNTTLDKHLRLAEKEVKLFRIDGSIRLKDWIEITILWFHKNELVLEWLDPKQYTEEYKDILNPEIDGEYKM